MAGVPSLPRRSRAHFQYLWAVIRRVHEDGRVTPAEDIEIQEAMQEHDYFEMAAVSGHLVRQATDRATDRERLDDVWAQHQVVLDHLPHVPLPANS